MTGKNNANKVGAHGRQEHPTASQINDIQNTQGPPVKHNPKDHNFSEERDTMRPKRGMQHVQQKAVEMKLDGRDEPHVDLHMHGERDDEDKMPVPPAEKKAGMRT